MKYPKPALIHSKFFPALQGPGSKMSASQANSAIYLTDSPAQIKNKINRYAFSGGQETAELHAQLGGNPDVDVSYQYLRFFLDDDEELSTLESSYKSGTLSTSALKARCIDVLQGIVLQVQKARALVTDETLKRFMDPSVPKIFSMKPPSVEKTLATALESVDIKS